MDKPSKGLLRRTGGGLGLAAAGLCVIAFSATPVAAGGNPNFDGVLAAKSPTGFPVSPQSLDASSGSATLNFNVLVSNLTSSAQKVALNFTANHILTYKGANVADGQPGKAGITFNGPGGTTQDEIAGTQSFNLSLAASEKDHKLALTRTISQCGYFQVDVWAPENTPGQRDRETLASGFIRVLGCGAGGVQGTPAPTASVSGISTGGGVALPSTGADLGGPAAGGLGLVTIGLGLVVAGARRNRRGRIVP